MVIKTICENINKAFSSWFPAANWEREENYCCVHFTFQNWGLD